MSGGLWTAGVKWWLRSRRWKRGQDLAHGESPIQETRQQAEYAVRRVSPWVDRVARAGYTAKGVVYATIGVLAMREALGLGGTTTGVGGAMRTMGPQPLGGVLLIVLAAGLAGYA